MRETELENAIIDKMQTFLLEMGKGFLFEARQKRFTFDEENFYVDLVFYNRLLQCYVLIDLKAGKLTHQDCCKVPLVSTTKDKKYGHAQVEVEPGLYVIRHSNNKMKKDFLETISKKLGLGWTVELIK